MMQYIRVHYVTTASVQTPCMSQLKKVLIISNCMTQLIYVILPKRNCHFRLYNCSRINSNNKENSVLLSHTLSLLSIHFPICLSLTAVSQTGSPE